MAIFYDWEAAAQARIECGMSLVEFHARRAAEFSLDGKVPSYETMRIKFRSLKYKAKDTPAPTAVQVCENVSVVELPSTPALQEPIRLPSIKPDYAHKCRIRIRRPDGTVIEVETHRPEWLLMKLISVGAFQNEL